jgi:hypothetical protein
MPEIVIKNDCLQIEFAAPWTSAAYDLFLKCKGLPEQSIVYDWPRDAYVLSAPARFAPMLGVPLPPQDKPWLPMPPHLFDYQAYFTRLALEAKRFALWMDTGLGKTACGLEFARQVTHRTGGRVLIITLNNLLNQWQDECRKFYGDVLALTVLRSRAELREWCAGPKDCAIALVNVEKFIPPAGEDQKLSEVNRLAGVIYDESSGLKSGGGVIKWAIIHSCKGIEYKLSMTATPAPNDTMEYASQASFLEKLRSEGDLIWSYFVRDKFGNWKIRDYAQEAFYRCLSSWSVYLRRPVNYGFADNLKDLPPPLILTHLIDPTPEQQAIAQFVATKEGQGQLFGADKMGVVGRLEASQAAKGFRYLKKGSGKYERIASLKPAFVAELVREEMAAGRQVLVWTLFDAEAEILTELLADVAGVEVLTGKVPKGQRPEMLERFRQGQTRCLIARASMLGFGMNFQFCTSMIFSGFNDSYEQLYQAIRRAYRYGQTEQLRVHIPYIKPLEGVIWDNLQAKAAAWERDSSLMERCFIKAQREVLAEANLTTAIGEEVAA